MKTLFGALLIGLVFISSCKKPESSSSNSNNETRIEEATIRWSGSYATDGCGYLVFINSVEFKPDNESFIDSTYQLVGNQNVTVEFYVLDNQIIKYCGFTHEKQTFNGLHVLSIERR